MLYSEESCCSCGGCGHLREFTVQAQGSCHLRGNCKLLRKSAAEARGSHDLCVVCGPLSESAVPTEAGCYVEELLEEAQVELEIWVEQGLRES